VVCTRRDYRTYLRSNGVQLPTLLINPPPHRSTARSIVSRFHSQPHRRPSVRQRYLRGISPPAYYILHYRPRSSESRSVYTRGNHSASLDSILHFAPRAASICASSPFFSRNNKSKRKNCCKINDFVCGIVIFLFNLNVETRVDRINQKAVS